MAEGLPALVLGLEEEEGGTGGRWRWEGRRRTRRGRGELNSGRFGRPAATAAGGGRSKVKFDNAALAPPTWTLRKCEGFAENSG